MLSLVRTPKEKMAAALTLLSLLAVANNFSTEIVLRFALLLASMPVIEYIFWKIRGVEPFRPTAGAVSALIIFLLADSSAPLYLVLLALAVSIATKQFLRPAGAHIFNPAASGLLAASFFGLPISWWGVGPQPFFLIATILLAGYVSLLVVRQYRIVFSFLATTVVASSLLISPQAALGQLLVGSFWFFTLVMLPEPQTAAHYPKTRIFYGVLVAVLSLTIPLSGAALEPLVTALLLGNLLAWVVERRLQK